MNFRIPQKGIFDIFCLVVSLISLMILFDKSITNIIKKCRVLKCESRFDEFMIFDIAVLQYQF